MLVDESLRKIYHYQQNMFQHYLDTLVLINNTFDLLNFVMGFLFKKKKKRKTDCVRIKVIPSLCSEQCKLYFTELSGTHCKHPKQVQEQSEKWR